MPQSRQALGELRALPKGFANSRTGDAILTAVKAGLEADPKSLPALDNGRDGHARFPGAGHDGGQGSARPGEC